MTRRNNSGAWLIGAARELGAPSGVGSLRGRVAACTPGRRSHDGAMAQTSRRLRPLFWDCAFDALERYQGSVVDRILASRS